MNTHFIPNVSIVIPVYNGADFMREAIDSALAQTYKNIEVILVNDGSQDNGQTRAIARSYGDRIRYFEKANGGVASALNRGIQEMTGDYFSWLSHDDLYYPHKIEKQIDYLATLEEKTVVLYSDWEYIDEHSQHLSTSSVKHFPPEQIRYRMTVNHVLHGCSLLIPKVCFHELGTFNEQLRISQDYDLWFRFAGKYRFLHIPEPLIKSRVHKNQGTVTLFSQVVLQEANALHIQFLHKLSADEILRATHKNLRQSYLEMAKSFEVRNLREAEAYARHLASEHANPFLRLWQKLHGLLISKDGFHSCL